MCNIKDKNGAYGDAMPTHNGNDGIVGQVRVASNASKACCLLVLIKLHSKVTIVRMARPVC